MSQGADVRSWRPLRLSIVATLALLTLQAWTGDFVNIFVTTSQQTVTQSLGGLSGAILSQGPFLVWHAAEGVLILLAATGAFVVSLRRNKRSVKIATGLALLSALSAGAGGMLFVLSGFGAGGSSMQMGGSFLGAYTFEFIALWYTK